MMGKGKIFIIIFLPAALVLLAALALIQQKNQSLSRIQFEDQLKNQWLLVSIIQRSAMDTESFRETSRSLGLRVTLIEASGRVIFDTNADEDKLEDHAQREEIRSAFLGYPAMAVRRSRSTGKPTIYYARLLDPQAADSQAACALSAEPRADAVSAGSASQASEPQASEPQASAPQASEPQASASQVGAYPAQAVLRVAYPADYFDRMQKSLMAQAFSGLAVLVLLVALFALAASRAVGKTFKRLGEAVREAEMGGERIPSFGNDPLDSALHSLSAASRELKRVAAEKDRLGARLGYILEHVQEGVVLLGGDDIVYNNERACQILNCRLPKTLTEITQAAALAIFERLAADAPAASLAIDGKMISVDYVKDGAARLIVLHDVSDREKYTGFKTELIANISHELKTPLTLIMTTSELIVKDGQMSREYLVKFLNTIHNNARRLNIILDDLISLHRLETLEGAEPLETNLEEIVAEVRDLVDLKGKKVAWSCDKVEAAVHPSHVMSVLTNLLTNAVKYSASPDIGVEVACGGGVLEIKVSDGGPVIPPAERERIFERFYSISSSRCRDRSGSGLGLAIVKHVAKLYGGLAKVEENGRGGNTFTVRLVCRESAGE